MEKFAQVELRLSRDVHKGEKASLLTLFNPEERFKSMDVLLDKAENTSVKVDLEGLGDVVLDLGNDMEKGQRKTIMTLFWFGQRSKLFDVESDADAGTKIQITLWDHH